MRGLHTEAEAHATAGAIFDLPPELARSAAAVDLPIGRVSLQQFGSHQDTDLAFTQGITFIVGPNGHGKSTIAEAMLWALSGRHARGLDGRGAGVAELVRSGTTAARVTVHTMKAGDVLREVKAGKSRLVIEEQAVTEPDPQLAIFARLATTDGRLRAVFQGAVLLDADHTTGKDLLLDVLNVRVTVDGHAYTLPQLEGAYDKAFEDRKAAKRDRDAIRVPTKPEQAAPSVEDLETRLASYREEEKTLIAQYATSSGRRQELERTLRDVTTSRDHLQQSLERNATVHEALDSVETQLRELQQIAPDAAVDAEEAQEVAVLQERLVDANGRLRTLQSAIAGIVEHSPTKGCVIDSAIPCKTSAKAFTDAIAKLRTDVAVLNEEVRTAVPRIQELQALASGRQQQLGERRRRMASLEQERSRLQNMARDRQTDETNLAAVTAAIRETEAALAACGDATAEPPALTALQDRIRRGEQEVLPQARRLVEAWKGYEDARKKLDVAAAKADRLEKLVEQLGPKGARVEALSTALTAFTERINGYLQRFGCTLAIELDPWVVRVNERPASRLSPSERFRVGACLQLAFADYTGLGFAVIDNADVLVTPEVRGAFNVLAIEWAKAEPGRQVIVIAAKEDGWSLPPIAGTAAYRVRQDSDGISRVTLEAEHVSVAA